MKNTGDQMSSLVKEFLERKEEQLAKFVGNGDLTDAKTFALISPLDYRYVRKKSNRPSGMLAKISPVLSEKAFWEKYVGVMEVALQETLAEMGISSYEVTKDIMEACLKASADDAYLGEDISNHDVLGYLDKALSKHLTLPESQRLKHFLSTSYDKLSNAYVLMTRDFNNRLAVPRTIDLERALIDLSLRYADMPQIGRTHLQHAEMITFGFALGEYVDRLGNQIIGLQKTANNLKGKYSGAVGAYNTSSLFVKDPADLEKRILEKVGLEPNAFSTQIVHPEPLLHYLHQVISTFGVLANFANDMRQLQRTEVNEVCEPYDVKDQKGSSAMPHKRNPINWENIVGFWKEFMPRIITHYMDQISDHQRDLTNSSTIRFVREIYAGFYLSVSRAARVTPNIIVDEESLRKNINMSKGSIISGPFRYLIAHAGINDPYGVVKDLSIRVHQEKKKGNEVTIFDLARQDESLNTVIQNFTEEQTLALTHPEQYIKHIVDHTKREVTKWKEYFSAKQS